GFRSRDCIPQMRDHMREVKLRPKVMGNRERVMECLIRCFGEIKRKQDRSHPNVWNRSDIRHTHLLKFAIRIFTMGNTVAPRSAFILASEVLQSFRPKS